MLAVALALGLWHCIAFARSADAGAGDGGVDAGDLVAESLERQAGAVRALVAGELASNIDPRTLFDIDLADPDAVALEAARLTLLLATAEADAGRSRRAPARPAVVVGVLDAMAVVPEERWQARLALDRARLAYLTLPAERRAALLAEHEARASAAAPSEGERRAAEAAAERERALASAQAARSEAERLVSEEHARLLAVEEAQATFARALAAGRARIDQGREETLAWERRAREVRGAASSDAVDRTYDALRAALRGARDELDVALAEASASASDVPSAGDDPLASLQIAVDTSAARTQRERVEAAAARLRIEEKAYHDERAAQLLDEVDRLNAERLALLPFLSSPKHAAIIGFSAAGLDQAAAEVRQLRLIARYHRFAGAVWLSELRAGSAARTFPLRAIAMTVGQWLAVVGLYAWLRRRVPWLLALAHERARAEDRRSRLARPGLAARIVTFLLHVHRPLLFLGLAFALSHALPSAARQLLEIRLLSIAVEWIGGGALVVDVVNAVAGGGTAPSSPDRGAGLRLRSLRLVGRVVVAFGLVLALTARLVGPGTIYQWVFSTCWLASFPVLAVLVRWWRETVFERAERMRQKSSLERWMLQHRRGWKSLVAVTLGALFLFGRGIWRVTRRWVAGFRVTRTVLAYLFRRELGKLEAERTDLVRAPIPAEAFDALDPQRPGAAVVVADADAAIEKLARRLDARSGGMIAIVGALGMGKTTWLRRLKEAHPRAVLRTVPFDASGAFVRAVADGLDGAGDAVVLLDDADRLVRPVMGGLAAFDVLLDVASARPMASTWVLAIDEALWLFLRRARGARPLFDEVVHLAPWREEELVALLERRTADAGLAPCFENLLDELPASADDLDRQDALAGRAESYYRLVWDYAGGNPGIALDVWRRALGVGDDGRTHVRFFQAPGPAELESLPDQSVFVLRAILQLGAARLDQIAAATMLHHADILDAVRHGQARGLVEESAAGLRITWAWHRAVSLFLQRRHLLVRA